MLTKIAGGPLADPGCVSHLLLRTGVIVVAGDMGKEQADPVPTLPGPEAATLRGSHLARSSKDRVATGLSGGTKR